MADVITFGNLLGIVTTIIAILSQTVAFHRWLQRQLEARDRAIAAAVSERNTMLAALRTEAATAREHARSEITRVDRDLAAMRNEFAVQLARIPTRDAMESLLMDRVRPLEADLRALVIELARIGVHGSTPTAARREDR